MTKLTRKCPHKLTLKLVKSIDGFKFWQAPDGCQRAWGYVTKI